MRSPRILIVDDDLAIVKFLRANLNAEDYQTLTALDGAEALEIIEREMPNLIILDLVMPKVDGFEVLRRLREWSQIPIIVLSARGDESDKIKCLGLGADDYISKPFGLGELIARIKAVLRRTQAAMAEPELPTFSGGDIEVNFAQRMVSLAGQEVKLTPTEYQLLQELVLNESKVLTHMHILSKVWGPEYREEKEYLHTFVRRLRHKLEADPSRPRHIVSVPGVGYRFTSQ